MALRSLVSVVAPPLCVACGASAGRVEPLCARCRAGLRWLPPEPAPYGWAPLAYEGGARALVRALKFRGAVGLAATMAAQIAATAPDELLDGFTLVPVPIHPARLRRRGYNQAEWLALELGERRGCPVSVCLERSGTAFSQVGRTRLERMEAIEHSIRIRDGCEVPKRAVVVDDVITTGATIDACLGALFAGGCELAGGLAYARTLGR
jgi:predicted amidophosphoribosyltransferase